MSPRVLHLISDDDRRGAQVFAEQLHGRLQRDHGIPGALVALRPGTGEATVDAALAPAGVRARRRLIDGYDVVVAHGSTTLDAAAIHAPGRFIYRSIGDPRFWLDRPRRRFKTATSLSRASRVVALYPDAAAALGELARLPAAKQAVIPNAVDIATDDVVPLNRADLGVEADAHVVLYVGSLSWEKRVDLIVDAVATQPSLHLVLAGGGSLEQAIEARAGASLGRRFALLGALSDVRPAYAAADVLALASVTEGQPAAILEAAAFGVPTVSPSVGGVADMIDRLGAGRLVDAESATDFGHALATEAQRRGHQDGLSGRAESSFDAVAAAWADVIRSTAASV